MVACPRFSRVIAIAAITGVTIVLGRSFFEFRDKRDNAWRNRYPAVHLSQIRSAEIAYSAENNAYVANQPPVTPPSGPGLERSRWLALTRFSIIGYAFFDDSAMLSREYNCSFALEGVDYPTMKEGFIARAVCDQNSNGSQEIYMVSNTSAEVIRSGEVIH